jgi:hypothetical protein
MNAMGQLTGEAVFTLAHSHDIDDGDDAIQ